MAFYYLAEDYFSSLNEEQKKCITCKKNLVVGERVYFKDFANGQIECAHCVEGNNF
jgi:hypothetical protein